MVSTVLEIASNGRLTWVAICLAAVVAASCLVLSTGSGVWLSRNGASEGLATQQDRLADIRQRVELSASSPSPETVEWLAVLTRDTNAAIRAEATLALACAVEHPDIAIPALTSALGDGDINVRIAAFVALPYFGSNARKPLCKALGSRDPDTASRAALALGHLGPDAAGAVPLLIEKLYHEQVRPAAAEALASVGPASGLAVPSLIDVLSLPEKASRGGRPSVAPILTALGKAGPPAKNAIPIVIKYRGDPNYDYYAVVALYRLAPEKYFTGMLALLRSKSSGIVLQALEDLRERARKELLRDVVRCLKYPTEGDQRVVVAAAIALGEMGPTAEEAIPALLQILAVDVDRTTRYAVAVSIVLVRQGIKGLPQEVGHDILNIIGGEADAKYISDWRNCKCLIAALFAVRNSTAYAVVRLKALDREIDNPRMKYFPWQQRACREVIRKAILGAKDAGTQIQEDTGADTAIR